MKLIDTHVHLLDDRFDDDRAQVIEALPDAGICAVVEACCEPSDIGKVLALTHIYPHVYGSAGVHPHNAELLTPPALLDIERALSNDKMLAVGEIGLDYHYDFAPRAVQKRAFCEQLELACAKGLPVIVHDREAHGDCLDLLRAFKGRLSGVMHCFSGSYETAAQCLDLGLYVAFGGALTFKNASRLIDVAARLPLSRIVLETDCPYMTPEPHRGQRCDPRMLPFTLAALARTQGADAEAVAAQTVQNARELFKIPH